MMASDASLTQTGLANASSVLVNPAAPNEAERRRALTGSRRQITVLFCDIVESVALSRRMDPEDLHQLLSDYQTRVASVIDAKLGHVACFMGDGVLAYFGWPRADEAHAESAVRAALAIIGVLRAQRLAVRIGIATGLVVTGNLPSVSQAQTTSAVGQTPNLAARLQTLAGPDTIVISDATRLQLGDLFVLTDLGRVELRGFDAVQPAWRVEAARGLSSRSEAVHAGELKPLIGRRQELLFLFDRWEQAKAGDGQMVVLSGEAGIGKSRLLAEFEHRLAAEQHQTLGYFCSQHSQDSALFPVIARWQEEASFMPGETAEDRLRKLETRVAGDGLAPDEVAILATMLSIPTTGYYPALELTPPRLKERTFATLLKRIAAMAKRRPLLLLFEDAHWADPSSLELLELSLDHLAGSPVLVLVSFRAGISLPWMTNPRVAMLSIGRLDRSESAALALQASDQVALPASLLDRITSEADGVPLFVEELTKALVEHGIELVSTGPMAGVPDTLQGSLMARLDRLPRARQIAQAGAVIGRQFSHRLLAKLMPSAGPQLVDDVAELLASGLAVQSGSASNAIYVFKHALVQEVAYGSLLRADRRRLHAGVAAALEDEYPEMVANQPELLAHHCAGAGLLEKAIDYWTTAGGLSLARSAVAEAESQLASSLALLVSMPPSTGRLMRELRAHLELSQARTLAHGFGSTEAAETCAQARLLWEQLQRPWQFVGPVLYGQWIVLLMRGDLDGADGVAAEFARLSGERGDHALRAEADYYIITTLIARGRFAEAYGLCLEASAPGRLAHPALLGTASTQCLGKTMHIHLFRAMAYLGHVDQAIERLDTAIAEAREGGSAVALAWTLTTAFFGEWTIRSVPDLLARAEEVLALSERHGLRAYAAAQAGYGWALVTLGKTQEGLPLLEASSAHRAMGTKLFEPFRLLLRADAHRQIGDLQRGISCIEAAVAMVSATDERWAESDIYRVRGELFAAAGDARAAEDSMRTALGIARRQSAKTWELRAALALAGLGRRHDHTTEGRDLLAPLVAWFPNDVATPDLQAARAFLAERG